MCLLSLCSSFQQCVDGVIHPTLLQCSLAGTGSAISLLPPHRYQWDAHFSGKIWRVVYDWVEDVFAACKTVVKLQLKGSGSLHPLL